MPSISKDSTVDDIFISYCIEKNLLDKSKVGEICLLILNTHKSRTRGVNERNDRLRRESIILRDATEKKDDLAILINSGGSIECNDTLNYRITGLFKNSTKNKEYGLLQEAMRHLKKNQFEQADRLSNRLTLDEFKQSYLAERKKFLDRNFENVRNHKRQSCKKNIKKAFLAKGPAAIKSLCNLYVDEFGRDDLQKSIFPMLKEVLQEQTVSDFEICKEKKIAYVFDVEDLRSIDVRLSIAWASNQIVPYATLKDLIECIKSLPDNYRSMTMLSARLGEIAAGNFYALSNEVKDIAQEQITKNSRDWLTHDLSVDGLPVDVKTARRPFSGSSGYSEFVVKYKKTSRAGKSVRICSVLADYVTLPNFLLGDLVHLLILGECCLEEIDLTNRKLFEMSEGILDFNLKQSSATLPGWFFEYPNSFYKYREAIISRCAAYNSLFSELAFANANYNDFSASMSAFSEVNESNPRINIKNVVVRGFLDFLCGEKATRHKLYTHLLYHFLTQLKSGKIVNYEDHFHHIFPDGYQSSNYYLQFPLGLFDPEKYIWNLLVDLTALSKSRKIELVRECKKYVQRHPGIITGDHPRKGAITLLAYCGGWRKERRVKCGFPSLLIGLNTLCDTCGQLICNECEHCSCKRKGKFVSHI